MPRIRAIRIASCGKLLSGDLLERGVHETLMFFSVIFPPRSFREAFYLQLAARSRDAVVVGGHAKRDFVVGQKLRTPFTIALLLTGLVVRAGSRRDEPAPACLPRRFWPVCPSASSRPRRTKGRSIDPVRRRRAVHFVHKGYFPPFSAAM